MIEKTLAKRYAAALLKVTDAEGTTEETESFLLALKDAYNSNKAFRALLAQPRVPRAVKKNLLVKIFEAKSRKSFTDFLQFLVDKNRQDIIPDIADMFDRLADASKGVVKILVKSWRPLTDAQRSSLQTKLEKLSGKKIAIDARVDPSVKGGMLVMFGDSVIDGTVDHRLKEIGEKFRQLQRR
ncbi:MAG: ATP synthase F1 subunit delta [Planctomycetes bacterium]|nr:ATP synthase F1 subunit delta [Planctomycetota bacterium]